MNDKHKVKQNYCSNIFSPYIPTQLPKPAIADSGCTGHYLPADTTTCSNKQPTTSANSISVKIPNGSSMSSTHTAELNIPNLPREAGKAHIFKDLVNPLLSLGQLCDFSCYVLLSTLGLYVFNKDLKHIITG